MCVASSPHLALPCDALRVICLGLRPAEVWALRTAGGAWRQASPGAWHLCFRADVGKDPRTTRAWFLQLRWLAGRLAGRLG